MEELLVLYGVIGVVPSSSICLLNFHWLSSVKGMCFLLFGLIKIPQHKSKFQNLNL